MAFAAKWAVLIGAGQYIHVSKLKYCSADVDAMRDALTKYLDFPADHIRVLSDTSDPTSSRAEVFNCIGQFSSFAQADDLLLLYFSGHGISSDGKDYLLPPEASFYAVTQTGIAVDDLADILQQSQCKHIVLFVDACREEVAGAKGLVSVGAQARHAVQKAGVVTFFSCDPKDRSYEIDEISHSSFTFGLLEAIQQGNYITVKEVADYLSIRVPAINNQYKKPTQQPFVVVAPLEKQDLPIFSSNRPRSDVVEIESLMEKIGDMYTFEDTISERYFSEAVEVLRRAVRSDLGEHETIQVRLIRRLSEGTLTGPAFEVAWKAVGKRFPRDLLSGATGRARQT